MPFSELLTYFQPLAAEHYDLGPCAILQTPGANILALNAAFFPAEAAENLPDVRRWFSARGRPALLLSDAALLGEDVGGLRVGSWTAGETRENIIVEQVSRLQLSLWSAVLAESYETLEWAPALARHFAARLEGDRASTLLLAYADGDPVGAGLWRTGPGVQGQCTSGAPSTPLPTRLC
ncbi:hypothetical protein MSS93_01180 [Deinococcus radiodurans]|nr:hypothetical protein MSS93_01180 [Deinococcus radiodurans]